MQSKVIILYFQKVLFSSQMSLDTKKLETKKNISSRKQVLTFHANYLIMRQFAWNTKACFLEKKI